MAEQPNEFADSPRFPAKRESARQFLGERLSAYVLLRFASGSAHIVAAPLRHRAATERRFA